MQLLHPERRVLPVARLAGPGEARGRRQPRARRGDGGEGGAAPPEAARPRPAEAEGVRGALQGRGLSHGEKDRERDGALKSGECSHNVRRKNEISHVTKIFIAR